MRLVRKILIAIMISTAIVGVACNGIIFFRLERYGFPSTQVSQLINIMLPLSIGLAVASVLSFLLLGWLPIRRGEKDIVHAPDRNSIPKVR